MLNQYTLPTLHAVVEDHICFQPLQRTTCGEVMINETLRCKFVEYCKTMIVDVEYSAHARSSVKWVWTKHLLQTAILHVNGNGENNISTQRYVNSRDYMRGLETLWGWPFHPHRQHYGNMQL